MVYSAAVSARRAENDRANAPGMCLQVVRTWCGIGARYPDAATAWRNTNNRHPKDRRPPRGAAVYWTGGSKGYGHIALSLGNGKVRSSDAGGRGRVATVDIGWFDRHWPSQRYAGWAWDINEVTIPHPKESVAASKSKTGTGDTPWEKVRSQLYTVLNGETAKSISKKRGKVQKFLADTKKSLDGLPKQ